MKKGLVLLVATLCSFKLMAQTYKCGDQDLIYVPSDKKIELLTFIDDERVKYDECVYNYKLVDKKIAHLSTKETFVAQCLLISCNGGCFSLTTLVKDGAKVMAKTASAAEGDEPEEYDYTIDDKVQECAQVE